MGSKFVFCYSSSHLRFVRDQGFSIMTTCCINITQFSKLGKKCWAFLTPIHIIRVDTYHQEPIYARIQFQQAKIILTIGSFWLWLSHNRNNYGEITVPSRKQIGIRVGCDCLWHLVIHSVDQSISNGSSTFIQINGWVQTLAIGF